MWDPCVCNLEVTLGVHKQVHGFSFPRSSFFAISRYFLAPQGSPFLILCPGVWDFIYLILLSLSCDCGHIWSQAMIVWKRVTEIWSLSSDHSFSDWKGKFSSFRVFISYELLLPLSQGSLKAGVRESGKRWKKCRLLLLQVLADPFPILWAKIGLLLEFCVRALMVFSLHRIQSTGTRRGKDGQVTTRAKVLWVLVVFSSPLATLYFSRFSNNCSMTSHWFYSCIRLERQSGVYSELEPLDILQEARWQGPCLNLVLKQIKEGFEP